MMNESLLVVRDAYRAMRASGQTRHRDIAEHLGISENTVKNHVRSILEKLPAKTRAEAAIVGLKRGLTTLPG